MLFAFSYVYYAFHVCIQRLYFYENINTVNKLVYLGLILNFIFTHLVLFYLSCVHQFLQVSAKSKTQTHLKFQKHKIDSDFILNQQTRKNKSTQDVSSEASLVHWFRLIAKFARTLQVNDNDLYHKRCKMSVFMSLNKL